MRQITSIFLLLLLLTGCTSSATSGDNSDNEEITYEQFNKKTKKIFESLEDSYEDTQVAENVITSIPSLEEWKTSEADFDVHNQNALQPNKIEVYIKDKQKRAMTKATFTYNKNFKNKQFLSVNRVDSYSNKLLKNSNTSFPKIYLGSFTTKGMLVEVLTFPIKENSSRQAEKDNSDEKIDDLELKLINTNRDVIESIQKAILKYSDEAN